MTLPFRASLSDDLSDDGHRPIPAQRARELREDREVGVQPHALDAANAQRQRRPLVLRRPNFALHGTTAAVERLGALSVAGDQRVQPIGLDP